MFDRRCLCSINRISLVNVFSKSEVGRKLLGTGVQYCGLTVSLSKHVLRMLSKRLYCCTLSSEAGNG